MKIGIITWCTYHNYGTFLQAFAMQEFLSSRGYDATLLDDSIIVHQDISVREKLKYYIKTIVNKNYRYRIKKDKNTDELFNQFKDKFLKTDKISLPTQYLDDVYDMFICGSDQIWNPNTFDAYDYTFYFANFSEKKKIAYAPSIGCSIIPGNRIAYYKEILPRFKHLSGRERDGCELLSRYSGKEVQMVSDPTFLLTKEQWINTLHLSIKATKPYILLYLLSYNQSYIDFAKGISTRYNIEFRYIHSIGVEKDGNSICGPIEFMENILNADFVITDSFHATVFSFIFQKQFLTLKRFNDTDKKSQNSRVYNLLSLLSLEDRLLDETSICEHLTNKSIDYSSKNSNLITLIKDSQIFLINAIKN